MQGGERTNVREGVNGHSPTQSPSLIGDNGWLERSTLFDLNGVD